ncbi:MAG: hypothetical protein ACTHO8_08195 [Solirubrobacterales bacterium]
MTEDWRVDSHDREIEKLKDDLFKANEKIYQVNEKIRVLEARPGEWLTKAMILLVWILVAVEIAVAIAHKH